MQKRLARNEGCGILRCQQLQPKSKMNTFSVIITRQSSPTDGTNGWHGADFDSRREALAYATTELANGYERAAVIQHTVLGQRRIATLTA
jgi:hypothetical protein